MRSDIRDQIQLQFRLGEIRVRDMRLESERLGENRVIDMICLVEIRVKDLIRYGEIRNMGEIRVRVTAGRRTTKA